MASLLIVDDDQSIQTQMKWSLGGDYSVELAGDRPGAVAAAAGSGAAVILLDLGLPPRPDEPEEGIAAMRELLEANPHRKIIVITGQGEKGNALRAVAEGAYDFLNKPIDMDELKIILKRAFHLVRLEAEYRELQGKLAADGFEGMLGTSPQMQAVFTAVRKVALADAPVLILGESGTGKEMVAQAIHRRSRRQAGPFAAINCSAIPENLLESELFGHEKGAFTGAHAQRPGRMEAAAGGTLFLDEIGEVPLALQVKLLRFLQEKSIQRVGGRRPIEIDARVLAATNVDLKQAMAAERFREDLYYRLAVVTVSLPPLRERTGDIPVLAKVILRRFALENNRKLSGFNAEALRVMSAYAWPGNVREMENRIRRAAIMAEGRHVTPEDLELDPAAVGLKITTLKEAREKVEREAIRRAMARHRNNLSRAAEELDVSRPTLYELMDKLGIRRE
ncbi:MAG: PEP-CTERM-box response regulator transcription factor [Lentisphaerae bacterium]|nr:PEP-CTERM-box response regulator transcription factor [Lentisphaerota bacterium]